MSLGVRISFPGRQIIPLRICSHVSRRTRNYGNGICRPNDNFGARAPAPAQLAQVSMFYLRTHRYDYRNDRRAPTPTGNANGEHSAPSEFRNADARGLARAYQPPTAGVPTVIVSMWVLFMRVGISGYYPCRYYSCRYYIMYRTDNRFRLTSATKYVRCALSGTVHRTTCGRANANANTAHIGPGKPSAHCYPKRHCYPTLHCYAIRSALVATRASETRPATSVVPGGESSAYQ